MLIIRPSLVLYSWKDIQWNSSTQKWVVWLACYVLKKSKTSIPENFLAEWKESCLSELHSSLALRYAATDPRSSITGIYYMSIIIVFSERELAFTIATCRRNSVCRLSVCCLWRWCTLLRRLNFSAIIFHHTIAQRLYYSGAKNHWWGRSFPLKFAFKVTHPLLNSAMSTNIGS